MTHKTQFVGAAVAAILLAGAPALAQVDSDETVARTFGFEANVQRDGAVYPDGDIDVEFRVYDSDGAVVFTEEWSALDSRSCGGGEPCAVPVRNGRMAVQLGRWTGTTLAHAITSDPDDYTVRFSVYDVDTASWMEINAAYPLAPVATGMWTTSGGSFSTSSLRVEGRLEIDGAVNVDSFVSNITSSITVPSLVAGVLTVNGTADFDSTNVEGWLTAANGLHADGQYEFGSSSAGDGGVLFDEWDEVAASSQDHYIEIGEGMNGITINGNVEQLDGFGASGTFRADSGMRSGDWIISDNQPFVFMKYISVEADGEVSTGISSQNWYCWVGGFNMDDGNFCQNSTSDCRDRRVNTCSTDADCDDREMGLCQGGSCAYVTMVDAYVYPLRDAWMLVVDFNGENMGTKEATVVCTRLGLFNRSCEDGSGYVEGDCDSEISGGSYMGWTEDHSLGWAIGGWWPNNWPGAFGAN